MNPWRLLSIIPVALIVLYFYAGWNIWNAILTSTQVFPGVANVILFLLWVAFGFPVVGCLAAIAALTLLD